MKLCSIWHGGELSWIERVCLASAIDVGHELDLYAYDEIKNVPKGVTVKDASEVMPRDFMVRSRAHRPDKLKGNIRKIGSDNIASFAHGADVFRMFLLQQGRGCYVDCDVLFLRQIPEQDVIFAWENKDRINNAVLRLPADSPIMSEMIEAVSGTPLIFPWWPLKRKINQRLRWLRGRDRKLEDMALTELGPQAVTPLIKKYGLADEAQATETFYPVPWHEAPNLFLPGAVLPITDKTIGVHVWTSAVKIARYMQPVEGSFMGDHCKRLRISDPRWSIPLAA
jgi:hypothetical protein